MKHACMREHLFSTVLVCLLIETVVSFSLSPFIVVHAEAPEDSWTTKQPMPTARGCLGVAVVNGKIYAIGGFVSTNEEYDPYSRVNEEYDPATNTWTTKKQMPTGRNSFGIAVYQNKIYVMGGHHHDLSDTGVNEVYDPATDSWETRTPMPTPRGNFVAHVVNGKIYLIGGLSWITNTQPTIRSLNGVYDPATDTWSYGKPIPTAVSTYASAVVDDKIYVIGGSSSVQGSWANLTQIYDPKTDSWSFGAPPPLSANFAIAEATTGVWAPKRIYLFGQPITQVYDPAKNSWITGTSMPTNRFSFAVAVVKDKLYAIGGSPLGLNIYDPPVHNTENEEYTPIGYGTVPPDTTLPTVSVVSPENKTYIDNHVHLNFTVSKSTSWIGYSLDGQANVTIAGNTTLTGLSDGSHSLTVYATDASGNVGASETIYFSIKTQQSEPFPTTWIVAAIAIIVVVAAALLVYFAKVKKTTGKAE